MVLPLCVLGIDFIDGIYNWGLFIVTPKPPGMLGRWRKTVSSPGWGETLLPLAQLALMNEVVDRNGLAPVLRRLNNHFSKGHQQSAL